VIAEPLLPLVRPIADLRTLEGNPRRGDVQAVKRSLARFGQRKPIVARGDGTVTAGNHTLLAARELGWTEIAVVGTEDDDVTAKAYALADNRTSALGSFDLGDLALMAAEVHAVDPGLLEAASFTEADLNALLAGERKGRNDPDDAPEPPEQPVTQRGDLWLLGPHRLLCGDSTKPDDVIRVMDGARATLMATDPPYLVAYDAQNHPASKANRGAANRNKEWLDYQEHTMSDGIYYDFLAAALEHAITRGALIYQWHGGTRADLLLDAWKRLDVIVHQQIIWVKARKVLSYNDFMNQHEPCYYGWRKGNRPGTELRPPVETPSVWLQDQVGETGAGHPTQKPVRLIRDPVRWHTRPGDVIYEPFGGSGTAVIAAETEARRCNAIELAPAFCDVICRRYQEHTGTKPVLEATGEPHDFT
jgi:DNA modification methylase